MQAEYHHTLKRKKNFVKCVAQDSNLGPLVYEASVLPTELSFRMKNWQQKRQYIFDLLFNKQYVSFDIPLQHCSAHIITHRWTPQVGQFGHARQHNMINCEVMLDQQCSSAWSQSYVNQLPWKHDKIINSFGFLPVIDSPNGLLKLKFVESTVFEIMGGGGGGVGSTPFVGVVGTNYLRTGRVKANLTMSQTLVAHNRDMRLSSFNW